MRRITMDEAQVAQLYSCLLLGVSQAEIGLRFCISQSKVSDFKNGRNISKIYRQAYLNYQKKTRKLDSVNQAASKGS